VTSPAAARWTTGPGAFWAAHDDRYEASLRPFTAHLLDGARIGPGHRVLDVGCGCGGTSRDAARRAAGGSVLGLDLSAAMVVRARERTAAEGPPNATFEIADAQEVDLAGAGYDAVISRMGVMFFDDAAAAFSVLAAALRPGGRLAFACWRERDRNPARTVPADALAPWVEPKPPAAPGEPGAFSLADPDRVRALLTGAGLVDIRLEPLAEPILLGADAEDAASFLLAELRADHGTPVPAEAAAALRAALVPYETGDGVLLGSAAWLVTARRPGG
jgi:SAM-dependent methyltransferase